MCKRIQALYKSWPEMKRVANDTAKPFIFEIRQGGSFKRH